MFSAVVVFSLFLTHRSLGAFAFNAVTFSSIAQCGSFNVTFNGGQAPVALPLTLTVVPFNSTNPLFISILASSWDPVTSTGAAVTFLPFAAGTSFVASLDDADGNPTGNVSGIIEIGSSDDSSCLPSSTAPPPIPPFQLDSALDQCESFNVSYPSTPPSVRVFRPNAPSFFLNDTNISHHISTFVMVVERGKEMVMLLDDGQGNQQTTAMTTVGGTTFSSSRCIPNSTLISNDATPPPAVKPKELSKNLVIGLVAGILGATIVVAIFMAIYIFRERRRRGGAIRDFTNLGSPPSSSGAEKGQISQPRIAFQTQMPAPPPLVLRSAVSPRPTPLSEHASYVRNTHFGIISPSMPDSPEFISYHDRGAEPSPWIQHPGYLQPPPAAAHQSMTAAGEVMLPPSARTPREFSRRTSVLSSSEGGAELDMDSIDQMLDMARLYTQPNSPDLGIDLTRQSTPNSVRSWNRSRAASRAPPEDGMSVSQWAGNQTARRLGGRSGSIKYSAPGAQVQKIEVPLPNELNKI